jgi:hypothetical protein
MYKKKRIRKQICGEPDEEEQGCSCICSSSSLLGVPIRQFFSKFPLKGQDMDVFYLSPVSKKVSDVGEPWYGCSPVGNKGGNVQQRGVDK